MAGGERENGWTTDTAAGLSLPRGKTTSGDQELKESDYHYDDLVYENGLTILVLFLLCHLRIFWIMDRVRVLTFAGFFYRFLPI
jgi:hypothetical protein